MTHTNKDGSWSLDPDDLFSLIAFVAIAHYLPFKVLERFAAWDWRLSAAISCAIAWPAIFLAGRAFGFWCNSHSTFRWFGR